MKSKKPLLIFDADSVLLDWLAGFLSYLKNNGHCVKHVEKYIGTTSFVPLKEITGSDCSKFNDSIMKDFAESGYLSQLDTFQFDAKSILDELNKRFDFAVVTCIGETEDLISQRNENLQLRYNDAFIDVVCIDYGKSKEDALRKFASEHEVAAFIDDRTKHLDEAIAAGIKPLLMSRGVDVCPTISQKYGVISCLSEIEEHI